MMRRKKISLQLLTALLIILLSSFLSAQQVQPYKAKPGSYQVAVLDTVLYDTSREREIPIRIYVPKANQNEKFGLIVFSHGLGGSREGYRYLGMHWASHGYIAIMPTHRGTDSDARASNGYRALVRAAQDIRNAIPRPLDMNFVIGQALNGSIHTIKGRVHPKQIGTAGHSFGAYTALGSAGQTIDYQGKEQSFTDPRVKATIAMSTQRPGILGLTENSWAKIRIPVLTMTGTNDFEIDVNDVSERRIAFDNMNLGVKYHVTINKARHSAFSDTRRRRIQRDPRHHGWILQISTAFWDAYLKNDPKALAWLEGKALEKLSGGECKIEMKKNE